MQCIYGHKMEIDDVEVSGAHQSGGDIVDAEYRRMWVCTDKDCDEVEPIINEQEDEQYVSTKLVSR